MAEQGTTPKSEYDRAMTHAAEVYADVLSALAQAGYVAAMTQTGGMCLAIEISLDVGDTVLVTDKDEILPWDRDDHRGWGIDRYAAGDSSERLQSVAVDDASPAALVAALPQFSLS
jgi:hypothetical protein